jgi:hypothetical protein
MERSGFITFYPSSTRWMMSALYWSLFFATS